MPEITYLSSPAEVSMANSWFEVASLAHFWIRRRFEVFRSLAHHLVSDASKIAEIGCGNGLLQRQIEEGFGKPVAGFDLNKAALKQNVSRTSELFCYDIFEKNSKFQGRHDLVLLFDVLEHIADHETFLEAVAYHIAQDGHLVVNVPAGQWAFSAYDRAAGHVRRYTIRSFRAALGSKLKIVQWTYWGLPLIPTLILRKLWMLGKTEESAIISAGFDSRNEMINSLLGAFSKCEPTPQKLLGTSLMAVLQLE